MSKYLCICCLPLLLVGSAFANSTGTLYEFDSAGLASRTYPFVAQRSLTVEPVYAATDVGDLVGQFDARDSQLQIAYDTAAAGVPTGLDLGDYQIHSLVITWTVGQVANPLRYDPTYDSTDTYDLTGRSAITPDTDAGRPFSLFGAGFRNGYTGFTTDLSDPPGPPLFSPRFEGYGPSGNFFETRHVFAIDFDEAGVPRDVSNNVDDANAGANAFEVTPFAIGMTNEIAPGELIPTDEFLQASLDMTFTVDVSDPHIHGYVARGLADGTLGFVLATLHPAVAFTSPGGAGGVYPSMFMRNTADGIAAAMVLDLTVVDSDCADANGDQVVDVADFIAVLLNFGQSNPAQGDANGDGTVTVADFIAVLLNFGQSC
ncbi:MAG: hypothetical protein AAGB34_03720 [Planctomycetota bacterium]